MNSLATDAGLVILPAFVAQLAAPQTQAGSLNRRQSRERDRKSTRLNSSHPSISYAVFCLKKKKTVNKLTYAPAIARRKLATEKPDPATLHALPALLSRPQALRTRPLPRATHDCVSEPQSV